MRAPNLIEIESLDELSDIPDVIMPKLDGCFGAWDRERDTYVSKRNNIYFNPPSLSLSGLYSGINPVGELLHVNGFQATTRTIRKETRDTNWEHIGFHIFDLYCEDSTTFQERRIALDALFRRPEFLQQFPFVRKVKSIPYTKETAIQLFNECRIRNLEGLVLRKHTSRWSDKVHGWKWKIVKDAEGTIISHEMGKGRLRGILGAYCIKTDDGFTINVGSGLTDAQRRKPLPVGTKITFKYRGRSEEGTPLKPSFKGVFIS